MASWRRMTSRFRHGLGTAGPPRPLQADTPVTWVTKVINAVGYRTSNGRFPKRENRSLVLRSAAEENGVSMLREGGHRPRDARAFLSVCGLTVTPQKATTKEHTTHTKERTPVVHLTLAYLTHSDRVTEVARGANARPGRSPKTNRDRRRRLRKHRRSSRVAAIVNDASFLFCGRTGFGGFEFSLFKR